MSMFEEFRRLAEQNALTVFGCFDIELDGITKDRHVLVLTEQFAAIYAKPKKSSETIYYWIDADSYQWNSDTIEIHFNVKNGGDLHFKCREAKACHWKIVRILETMFTPSELTRFAFDRYPHIPYQVSGAASFGRFIATMKKDGKDGNEATFADALKNLIFRRQRSFSTIGFKGWESDSRELYDVLATLPYLESLTIKRESPKALIYDDLSNHLRDFQYLRHLKITEPLNKKFEGFLETLKQSRVDGLSIDFEIEEEYIETLAEVIQTVEMRSIAFHHVFRKESLRNRIVSDLLMPCTSLRMVTFVRANIDVKKLAKSCQQLVVVSLISCNLDVDKAINDTAPLTNLRILCLKGNNGIFETTPDDFPRALVRLDLSCIEWKRSSIKPAVSFLCSRPWSVCIELFLEGATVKHEDSLDAIWEAFDEINYQLPISAFSWDKTEPSSSLFTFLAKAPNLQNLFLHGVFSDDDPESIRQFASILPYMSNLRLLDVSGSDTRSCGESLIPVIEAATQAPLVNYLDVSKQKIGNNGIRALTEFVRSKPNPAYLAYDSTGANDWPTWNALIKAAEMKENPWGFMYPLKGMFEYMKSGQLSQEDAQDVKRRILKVMGTLCPADETPYELITDMRTRCKLPEYLTPELEAFLGLPPHVFPLKGGEEGSRHSGRRRRRKKLSSSSPRSEESSRKPSARSARETSPAAKTLGSSDLGMSSPKGESPLNEKKPVMVSSDEELPPPRKRERNKPKLPPLKLSKVAASTVWSTSSGEEEEKEKSKRKKKSSSDGTNKASSSEESTPPKPLSPKQKFTMAKKALLKKEAKKESSESDPKPEPPKKKEAPAPVRESESLSSDSEVKSPRERMSSTLTPSSAKKKDDVEPLRRTMDKASIQKLTKALSSSRRGNAKVDAGADDLGYVGANWDDFPIPILSHAREKHILARVHRQYPIGDMLQALQASGRGAVKM